MHITQRDPFFFSFFTFLFSLSPGAFVVYLKPLKMSTCPFSMSSCSWKPQSGC
ncbi:hypothetical protein BDQ94DRAFT_134340 [Aspergillus welwitschiae]|uniref:Uncharacterized protein n=1 Tax=Aspergillus welwitschiae TaxID=1341132 RepID=A0A3F3QI70_9EURO|nr:hypothetical protein BDQ94DRAFT_134340 [Aspergillus welwitschiae]RDH38639.1 hypothetical protein BDQ94DRAFT_134340 [Aspergillus welwitschiae]